MDKAVLVDWVLEAVTKLGGRATVLDVARHIWAQHEADLRRSGDLFYTWQYDYRWAATKLRQSGKLKAAEDSPSGYWELARPAAR